MQNHEPIKVPKWKRITLPETLFRIKEKNKQSQVNAVATSLEHLLLMPFKEAEAQGLITTSDRLEDRAQKHLGQPFIDYTNEQASSGYYIVSKNRSFVTERVQIQTVLSGDHVENHLILAREGSKLTVFMDYSESDGGSGAHHYGITRVVAQKGSEVTLVKAQRLGTEAVFMDQCFISAAEGAKVALIDVQMGANTKGIAYEAFLEAPRADVTLKSLYYGEKNEQLDLSFTMRHFGKHTTSEILSKGVLDHEAKKVFRGNLIFETGSAQSVGREREYVMLLSENVKSDAIPALLCSEDDVVGEHAASVGQVDQMKLFYLMSRGLSEAEAKKLVIKAAFEEIFAEIPDDGLKNKLLADLDGRIG